MDRIVVIVPIYRDTLSEYDRVSLDRTYETLSSHDIFVVYPEGMDTSRIAEEGAYPLLKFKPFPPSFFKGIMGYNRMMLSPDFYSSFQDYEYMLICQTDAYVFRDELAEWCSRGYDYVGAPWLRRPVYDNPVMKFFMALSLRYKKWRGVRSKQELYNKIGNGGLSLRKIASFYKTTVEMADVIAVYLNREKKHHLFNEDVFWATEPHGFTYPTVEEALLFSFDKYPDLCYKLTHGRLPMGCHAWYKRKMKRFWDSKIM